MQAAGLGRRLLLSCRICDLDLGKCGRSWALEQLCVISQGMELQNDGLNASATYAI
jgi:hypothetical protein